MQSRGYLRLKNGEGKPITTAQLPTAGLTLGMTNDRYRSLVYFTRDIGYSKPAQATDYLEFYWPTGCARNRARSRSPAMT